MHCCSYAKPLAISDAAYYARIKGRVAAQPQWNLPSHLKHIVSAVNSKSHADCSSSAVCNFSDSQHVVFLSLTQNESCSTDVMEWDLSNAQWDMNLIVHKMVSWSLSAAVQLLHPCFYCLGAFVCWYSFMHEASVRWASVSVNLLISIKLFMQLILLMKSNFKF